MNDGNIDRISAWFAGPKAENAGWFSERLRQVIDDYYAWRRNYFPEDGAVIGSALRRNNEPFQDAFEDRLTELLGRLKADVPFQSPRYAAHMLAEQTLPGIAGYFAAMLYNPNNVTADVAPVTVRLELEAGRMLSKMIGYGSDAWAHLCSGGTTANLEALWMARSARDLPWVVRDARRQLGLQLPIGCLSDSEMLALTPTESLGLLDSLWFDAGEKLGDAAPAAVADAIHRSAHNVKQRGLHAVCSEIGSTPVVIVPETHHYSFEKILDVLGLGRLSLVAVPIDGNFRMRVDELAACLDRLDKEHRHALAVVAVVGSTEEGSIDPVDQIVALAKDRRAHGRPSFWLHADGAYGGYLRTITVPSRCGLGEREATVRINGAERKIAIELPEHGECTALESLAECDSVTIDPHKLGYIPYPAGAICFRNNLVKTLARQEATYIDEGASDPDHDRSVGSVGLYVLEGSKPGAAAAAVWLSHKLIPLDNTGHGQLMRENIRNACELHALLEHFPGLSGRTSVRAVCLCPPGSNIVCYAFRPTGATSLAEVNALNRAIFSRFTLNPGQRVYDQRYFVSRTELSAQRYSPGPLEGFLHRLGASVEEYRREGVFLLRSVLMNPWYERSKRRGSYVLSDLVSTLFDAAVELMPSIAGPAAAAHAGVEA